MTNDAGEKMLTDEQIAAMPEFLWFPVAISSCDLSDQHTLYDYVSELLAARATIKRLETEREKKIAAAYRHGWDARCKSKTNDIEVRDLQYAAALSLNSVETTK